MLLKGMLHAPDDLVREGEFDLGVVELHDVLALALGSRDGGGLDDLDAGEPHAVAGTHLLQHATAGVRQPLLSLATGGSSHQHSCCTSLTA
jgi:hypothetical protein